MLDTLTVQTTSSHPTLLTVFYASCLSFVLSGLVAFTYRKTFRGLSFSRNYVQALVLSSMVAATVMQAIGDSLARGLGMIGALAIIRFRTNFKDARDIIFMFAALAAGIACGVTAFTTAVVGTLVYCLVAVVLYYSPMGGETYFDGMLRFNIENKSDERTALEGLLNQYCANFALITLRDLAQGNRLDYAYHVKLKRGKSSADLIGDFQKKIGSVKGLSLMLQETTIEL